MMAPDAAVVTPAGLWGAWTLDLSLLLALAGVAVVYGHTVGGLWRTGGRGAGIDERQVGAFSAGLLVLVVALVSPLDAAGEALFAAHMVQHLLLTLVAAPLLLLGRVHLGLIPALPLRVRRRLGRRLARGLRRAGPTTIVVVVFLHIATVLAWHFPPLYELAIDQPVVHVAEHVTMLGTALGFWAAMGAARPRPVAAAGLASFVSALAFTLLSATLTFASEPWYASHLATTRPWGLSPLEDQQLAAAIMWVPGGILYLGATAAAVVRWLRADERVNRHVHRVR